ncbi:glycosyltransferase family 2 protein [Anaerotignum lactatifermentans]|uniref:Glycosyltransferase family 2 protein n=1 Tax=Anaerotignum lactatifermentans TaxID=160404 RepID=A0ABS2GB89_9FIRM|nr:glycosyltransferase [Anaerotignum lactatifermentans]MBM6830188.1 glycosyltransferase family 2 protein [Anaerotignum lactatifermentans]MBM6878739.1 glycosyltransferase family 2 protein [Anaerotignum lactatifermentans]MBM6951803.1 glycosyltransferase family 2 protein [Anaerotignum lactatifermentans]
MMDAYKTFFSYVGIFFVLYLIGYASFLFLSVAVGSATLYQTKRRNRLKNELAGDYFIPVSIIVPAYNEEVTIETSIRSLLALEYKLYEIIVVDDGSRDRTGEVVREAFHMHHVNRPIQRKIVCQPEEAVYETYTQKVPITLIQKRNGGKADALNMGINAAKYPYFICMDADSVLQYDALEKIMRPVLEEGNVVAVGGAVRPSNGAEIKNGHVVSYRMPDKLLPCMQVLEYDRSFLAARILFDKFNGSIIISGAFGLFKKSVVVDAGGYDATTMGEDMELVVKLHVFCREHNIPYRIRYATDAICWTQAPESLGDLRKQRRRWHIGLFQSMMGHRRMFANFKYGLVGFVSYLYFLIYELFSPYIEVFGVFTIILAFMVDLINVPFMILFFFIYVMYSSVLSLTAFFSRTHTIDLKLRISDVFKAIGLCAVEVSCLRFILAWTRAAALIGYKRKKQSWGSIERKKIEFK